MSVVRALTTAVRDQLRAEFGSNASPSILRDDAIEVMPDARVPPTIADYFLSIYCNSEGREGQGPIRIETFEIMVAVTVRKAGTPSDRRGVDLYTDVKNPFNTSHTEICNLVKNALDGNYNVIERVNQYLDNGDDEFATIPFWVGENFDEEPQEVGAEHFYIQPKTTKGDRVDTFEGFLIQIPFVGVKRFINTLTPANT